MPRRMMLIMLAVVFAGVSYAGLDGDVNAFNGWSGTSMFGAAAEKVEGSVQYAVYRASVYESAFGYIDLDPAANFVYSYQIYNSASSQVNIDFFSVGLIAGVHPITDVGYNAALGDAGGTSPMMQSALSESVLYVLSAGMGADSYTTSLVFASAYGPTEKYGVVSAGELGGKVVSLPTPDPAFTDPQIPEPATMALVGLGALLLKRRKNA